MGRFTVAINAIRAFNNTLTIRPDCRRLIGIVYCHYYFPRCDSTGNELQEQKLCRETCNYLWRKCDEELKVALDLNEKIKLFGWKYSWDIINCDTLPVRNAGMSPECWYFDGKNESFGKLKQLE